MQFTIFMLIPFFFLMTTLIGHFWTPIDHFRTFGIPLHQACLAFVPKSKHALEYQTLLCGEPLSSERELAQNSGLIHWLLVYGFQIYLVDRVSRWLFLKPISRNLFCAVFVGLFLSMTAFHPSSVRAAIALLLRRFSAERKFFWSPLQTSIFSGFFALCLQPTWSQNPSLFISWVAAMTFGFFHKFKLWTKMIAVAVFILPMLSGFVVAHPLLNFIFSLLSRPALLILFPLCILGCFEFHALEFGNFAFEKIFWIAKSMTDIFWPIEFNFQFSFPEIWIYLLLLMVCFLFLENRKLRLSTC